MKIIVGRVVPHIYAFRIDSFPPSYKVGDTFRTVGIRIAEWKAVYNKLNLIHNSEWEWCAKIDGKFFRDHAVHYFLENKKNKKTMPPEDFKGYYPSREFYLDISIKDIEEAVQTIKASVSKPDSPYKYYSAETLKEEIIKWQRGECLDPRDNQKEVIENFEKAVASGFSNLLLYAVMRFGKTYTTLKCAQTVNAKSILVVSGKGDVGIEWKKAVESIGDFVGYEFYDKNSIYSLDLDNHSGTAVVFLTLQDLQGPEIKERHKKIFDHRWDLLVVDETHFGARAKQFGIALSETSGKQGSDDEIDDGDTVECLAEGTKSLRRSITLHLSGTPYRILMSNEFKKSEIIASVRYSDIIKAQQDWIKKYVVTEKENEWDNPYFGFPQMVRFAFNLNEESVRKLEGLKSDGASDSLNLLFSTRSNTPDKKNGRYRQFVYRDEVMSFLQAIDGTKEDVNVLGFLDNDRIKNGKLCRHIVMVLPYRASCDAMQQLIESKKDIFKNLGTYHIVNIAGHDSPYNNNREKIKADIEHFEERGEKTLSLTVNRMLTGSTVEQWDTMIYLKDTLSPQEYDQAIFRLQNPFVKTYKDDSGQKVIKYDMKPQTILVDFAPQRMFLLEQQKSLIENACAGIKGNDGLRKSIADNLQCSPIIFVDHNKMREVEAADVINAVRDYASSKDILQEAGDIPVDENLLDNELIVEAISNLNPFKSSKGLLINPNKGSGDEADPETGSNGGGGNGDGDSGNDDGNDSDNSGATSQKPDSMTEDEKNNLAKQLQAYYSLILYFAFLTEDKVTSVDDILRVMNIGENKRIANNIGLEYEILKIFRRIISYSKLSILDNKIENINELSHDNTLSPLERAQCALKRFTRLSESEIVTPPHIAAMMVEKLPDNLFDEEGIALDIASKQGEFAVALYKKFSQGYDCTNLIYSICTSKLAYEFTRKTYRALGLNPDNVISDKTTYDLIDIKPGKKADGKLRKKTTKTTTKITIKDIIGKDMDIRVIIGNPPYSVNDGSGASDDASNPIYQDFVSAAKNLNSQYVTVIIPSKWMVGGKPVLKRFRSDMMNDNHISLMVDFENDKEVFPNAYNDGGICFFMYNEKYDERGYLNYVYHPTNGHAINTLRKLNVGGSDIVIRDISRFNIIEKVSKANHKFQEIVSLTRPYGIRKDVFNSPEKYKDAGLSSVPFEGGLKIYGVKGIKGGAKRTVGYISPEIVTKNKDTINQYKLFFTTSYSTNATTPPEAILGDKNEICTETFLLIGPFSSKTEQLNCKKFLDTNFFKILLYFGHGTMQVSRDVFRFIPLENFSEDSDIDWSKSIEEIDAKLYEKYHIEEDALFIKKIINSKHSGFKLK